MQDKPELLLHICCAPCSPHIVNLLGEAYRVTAYFYNPNIQPEDEYRLREREIINFSKTQGFELIIGEYEPDKWNEAVRGLEEEREGGRRCEVCFRFRFEAAAREAAARGIPNVATTLTISPHKSAAQVNAAGRAAAESVAGVEFLEADFKKKDGFKITTELSRAHNFYRQDYCGCIHSKIKK